MGRREAGSWPLPALLLAHTLPCFVSSIFLFYPWYPWKLLVCIEPTQSASFPSVCVWFLSVSSLPIDPPKPTHVQELSRHPLSTASQLILRKSAPPWKTFISSLLRFIDSSDSLATMRNLRPPPLLLMSCQQPSMTAVNDNPVSTHSSRPSINHIQPSSSTESIEERGRKPSVSKRIRSELRENREAVYLTVRWYYYTESRIYIDFFV